MGRLKKGYNWKARQVVKTEVDNTAIKSVQLELPETETTKYDESNALLLPSKKRKAKIIKDKTDGHGRILSKKQRKKLEKIVELKEKKANRADLLESLAQVQAPESEMALLTSLSSMQTRGLKRHFIEESTIQLPPESSNEPGAYVRISSVAGFARKRRKAQLDDDETLGVQNKPKDPNVVGFGDSESGSDDDAEEEDEEVKEEQDSPEEVIEEVKTLQDGEKTDPAEKQSTKSSNSEQPPETSRDHAKTAVPVTSLKATTKEVSKDPRPAVFVPVNRKPEIQAARLKLPILAEEQVIMETIRANSIVILAGETGSGKTTQVPQFLYEAGYAENGKMIGITEPRRVAATSMAQRVAEEMNLHDSEVAYQIRFEGNTTDKTRIKFMTDGVLLKEVQKDFLLTKYSVIIIDEAHERSVFTDILIGLLSRIVPLRNKRRNPLKLIIMSATLRVEDFTENTRLFKFKPPVIQVESRQFPVTVHFNKRTALEDYVDEAYRKVCKIHRKLPDGGILVFLTGQQEVNTLVKKLQRTFPFNAGFKSEPKAGEPETKEKEGGEEVKNDEDEDGESSSKTKTKKKKKSVKQEKDVTLPNINLDNYAVLPPEEDVGHEIDDEELDDADVGVVPSDEEAETGGGVSAGQPLYVLPLYSLLPSHKQRKVFEPVPEGSRLCVVATNVAETSLTIPSIRYVVDAGRAKTKLYDKVTGVSAFQVLWTSQASADQRAGRAGRTGPGHCYRLYSSAVFTDEFQKFSPPDIARRPIDDLVLQMKAMDIQKVVNFPFPSPPELAQLQAAEERLIILGALEQPAKNLRLKDAKKHEWSSKITPLGKAMAAFPVAPRFAKMLALSHQQNLLPFTISMVAALSIPELLLETPLDGAGHKGELQAKWQATRRAWAGSGHGFLLGDPMVLLKAVGAAEFEGGSLEFCETNGLRSKALREVRKLRVQLTNEVNVAIPSLNLAVDPKMAPPSEIQAKMLRQILLCGMPDRVVRKVGFEEVKEMEDKAKWKYAYRTSDLEEPVFLHQNSLLRSKIPEWVVYQEVFETNKMYIRGVTAIEPEWLPIYCPSLCTFSEPLDTPPPHYDAAKGKVVCHRNVTFGRRNWQLPVTETEYPPGLDRYKWFARYLLDGSVCPKLSAYVNVLLSPPATMIKTWAKLQPRTESMLKALAAHGVDNKETLNRIWAENLSYLLAEYKEWLPQSLHSEVELKWPSV